MKAINELPETVEYRGKMISLSITKFHGNWIVGYESLHSTHFRSVNKDLEIAAQETLKLINDHK